MPTECLPTRSEIAAAQKMVKELAPLDELSNVTLEEVFECWSGRKRPAGTIKTLCRWYGLDVKNRQDSAPVDCVVATPGF